MGRPKKYFTEEERIAAQRAATRRWKTAHPDYFKQYRQVNKEKIAACWAEWYQNNKEKVSAYYQANKEKINKQQAEYRQNNKEHIAEQHAENRMTPNGRAQMHVDNYTRIDKMYNRGECTLTADWIVEHIFNQPCHYCGRTDWHELGCDRVDNSLPHTPDNVVPCCTECNKKKARYSYEEYIEKIKK